MTERRLGVLADVCQDRRWTEITSWLGITAVSRKQYRAATPAPNDQNRTSGKTWFMWFASLFHGMVSPDGSYKLKESIEYTTQWFGLLTRLGQDRQRKLMLLLPGSISVFYATGSYLLHKFRVAYSNATSHR